MKRRFLLNQANDDLVLPGGDVTPPADDPNTGDAPTDVPADDPNTGDAPTDVPPADDKEGAEDLNLFEEGEEESLDIDVEVVDYELELPEDSKIPEEEFDALVELAKEQGLTKEEAEARLAIMEKSYSSAEDLYVKARADKLKQELFQDEYFNTPEKRKEAQEDIARALKEYKNPELVKLVKEDPFIRNNKEIMRLLVDMGRSLRPEKAPAGNQEGVNTGGDDSNSILKQYYPSMF